MKTETRKPSEKTTNALPMDRRTFLTPYLEDSAERTRLLRFCTHLTGNIELAEDIAQEALAEAWRQADTLQSPEYWRSWVFGIARHMFLRWRSKHLRESSRLVESTEVVLHSATDLTTVADPEAALEQREMALLVDRALRHLPVASRQILEQHYIGELPQAEIAARLGITENTTAVRLHRGREALRKVLLHELRSDAAAFGLITPNLDESVQTHIWCPICGRQRLNATRDTQGRQRLGCSACFFIMGPNPINYPSNCIFAHEDFDPATVAGEVRGYKPLMNRMTAFWKHYLFTGRERGQVNCVGCGADLRLNTTRPAHLCPRPYAGFHTHCVRCQRIHVVQPTAFTLCLDEVQKFWKKHPRMRIRGACGIGRGQAFLIAVESVMDQARTDILFSASDYGILSIQQR
jgi:RNA polymerase sigma-70 factor (ECF subfamily)